MNVVNLTGSSTQTITDSSSIDSCSYNPVDINATGSTKSIKNYNLKNLLLVLKRGRINQAEFMVPMFCV